MHLPRRGEVAAYLAKQLDVPFGEEQKKIGRLKEGASTFQTANEVAKLLAKRANQLIHPADQSSPGDIVEKQLGNLSYRLLLSQELSNKPLEFIWRDVAKFFLHHSKLAASIGEHTAGATSSATLDMEIYLCYFALPVLANNLAKYDLLKLTLECEGALVKSDYWFLPTVISGREDCDTPFAKAFRWLRGQLGGDATALSNFLCPESEPDSAMREIEKWRCGDVVPKSVRIELWARSFEGDRTTFRKIFHLSAMTTRIWRNLVGDFGYEKAIKINAHLRDLMCAVKDAHAAAGGGRPDFSGQPNRMRSCLGWLYNGPQAGPISLGPNYQELVVEMQYAYVADKSPLC